MIGGEGKDIFFYAKCDGKDTIPDYKVVQDKIKITSSNDILQFRKFLLQNSEMTTA
ncbi:MAG: hypothetical protein IK062_08085 [Selenomonadaceae bacterium]|nr:hypothetical protein [Selenomonadaceae bacterium]